MLTSLRLRNWKSFGEAEAIPIGPLTLLVGPNGSGKSNVIDALRFLQGAALDLPVGDVLRGRYEGQREVWPGIRGHLVEAARSGSAEFELESRWANAPDLFPQISADSELHRVRVATDGDVTVEEEWLGLPSDYWYGTHTPTHRGAVGRTGEGIRVALRATGRGASPVLTFSASRLVLGQIQPAERVLPAVVRRAHSLQRTMREIIFLDVQPARMRDYRPESANQLGVNAENATAILARLAQRDEDQLLNVRDWLSELCAPAIKGFEFEHTRTGEVMMFLVEESGAKVSARSVSDGTLRFLGMVVALLTVPEESMIVVEEPDVGLHPSRIHLLASLLEDTVKRRSLQVIATTHSPTLLSHLSSTALADVVAFGRDSENGTSVGRRIGDLPHFGTLRESSELEHLVSTGWLERAL